MRLLTLNLRHGGGRRMPALLAHLLRHEADVLVLSEHRHNAASALLREGLAAAGYAHQAPSIASAPRLNHLLVASRLPLAPAPQRGLRFDARRMLPVQVAGLLLVAVHLPNLRAKIPHWQALLRLGRRLNGTPAVYMGDFNTGREPQDVETPGFAFTGSGCMEALEALGWVDAWRRQHPQGREYTWYSHRHNGFRLDHAFLSPACAPRLRRTAFDHTVRTCGASDHSALVVELAGPDGDGAPAP